MVLIKPHFISQLLVIYPEENFLCFYRFIFGILWMGIYPEPFLDTIHCSTSNLIYQGF